MNPNLKKLEELMKLANDGLTKEDFTRSFEQVMQLIVRMEEKLLAKVDTRLSKKEQEMNMAMEQMHRTTKETHEANDSTLSKMKVRAMESINSMFSKMRLQDRMNEMMDMCEEKMSKMDKAVEEMKKENEMGEHKKKMEGMEKTLKEIGGAIITLGESLNLSLAEKMEELSKKAEERISTIPRNVGFRSNNSPLFHDMSSQTNGVTKIFTVPKNRGGVVFSSDFPTALMEGNGYTINASRTQITLTIDNANTSGSQLVFICK